MQTKCLGLRRFCLQWPRMLFPVVWHIYGVIETDGCGSARKTTNAKRKRLLWIWIRLIEIYGNICIMPRLDATLMSHSEYVFCCVVVLYASHSSFREHAVAIDRADNQLTLWEQMHLSPFFVSSRSIKINRRGVGKQPPNNKSMRKTPKQVKKSFFGSCVCVWCVMVCVGSGCALTILISLMVAMLRTNILTRTMAGPSVVSKYK